MPSGAMMVLSSWSIGLWKSRNILGQEKEGCHIYCSAALCGWAATAGPAQAGQSASTCAFLCKWPWVCFFFFGSFSAVFGKKQAQSKLRDCRRGWRTLLSPALHSYFQLSDNGGIPCGDTKPCLSACSPGLRVPSGWSRATEGISPIPISLSSLGMYTVDGMAQLSHLPACSGWTPFTSSGCCAGAGLLSSLPFSSFFFLIFTEVNLGMLGVFSTGGSLCLILLEFGLWGLQWQGWEMSRKRGKDTHQQDRRWLCRASLQPCSVPSCFVVTFRVMWVDALATETGHKVPMSWWVTKGPMTHDIQLAVPVSHWVIAMNIYLLREKSLSHVCPSGSDCNLPDLSSYSPKREGNKAHHIKVTSFVHNKRAVQARRPLSQQGINTGDKAKSVGSGNLCHTLLTTVMIWPVSLEWWCLPG